MHKQLLKFAALVLFALLFGLIAAQEQQEGEQQPAEQPRQPAAVDPRWGAPGWWGPGWWDPAMVEVDVALVRVGHFSPNAEQVNISIAWPEGWWGLPEGQEGETAQQEEFEEARTQLEGLEYGQITDYVIIPAGNHTIFVTAPDDETVVLYQEEINFGAGSYYTVAALGFVRGTDPELDARIDAAEDDAGVGWFEGLFTARDADDLSFRLEVYDDDPTNFPAAGWAHVRVIHAAAGAPGIDIWAWWTEFERQQEQQQQEQEGAAPADPATAAPMDPAFAAPATDFFIVSDLQFPFVSDYEGVRAIGYDLEVRFANSDIVIHEFPGDQLQPGAIYTIFVTGTALEDGQQIEAIVLTDVMLVSTPAEEIAEEEAEDEEAEDEEVEDEEVEDEEDNQN
jgi:hypothetical protein